ncbi:MAG: hypothetical protein MUF06_13265 [Pirellulaceae bacterium]|nr:hypothetical protein [Pirellulaceae bacterium]
MLTILKNSRLRLIISLGAGFSYGQLIFGAWRDTIGPNGVLLVLLAAMPVLSWGFYLHFGAIASYMESAQKAN